jgi:hypothetical protein
MISGSGGRNVVRVDVQAVQPGRSYEADTGARAGETRDEQGELN